MAADPAHLLEQFRKFRDTQLDLMEPLRRRVSKRAFGECARKLMAVRTRDLGFDDPQVARVVMDHCIFGFRRAGKTAVDRYLATSSQRQGSAKRRMLEMMQRAHYSIFGVDDVREGLGAQVKDLLQKESFLLLDEALARRQWAGFAMAGRILRFEEFALSTGAMLLLTREVMEEVGEPLGALLKGRGENRPADLSADEKTELAELLGRACLVMEQVEFVDSSPWKRGAPQTA